MSPEEIQKMMVQIYEIISDTRTTDAISLMYWNLFTKLKERGFTEEQALTIVSKFDLKTK